MKHLVDYQHEVDKKKLLTTVAILEKAEIRSVSPPLEESGPSSVKAISAFSDYSILFN